jgi:hypothetical protein
MRIGRISLLVVAAALLAAPGALASGLPKVIDSTGHLGSSGFYAKPKSIVYTGDGSRFFAGHPKPHHKAAPLSWSSWTATGGRGSGYDWIDNCSPNCAAGTFHQRAVKLHVWRPRHVGGHYIFTRMTVTYTGHDSSKVLFKVVHRGGVFYWSYPA